MVMWCRKYLSKFSWFPPVPVICIGNLSLGGTGKTPLIIELLMLLKPLNPVVIMRGYRGRRESTGGKVDLSCSDGALEYGDEAWLVARYTGCPVFVGKNRKQSIIQAISDAQPKIILMDDGFQNLAVRYFRTILILDDFSRHENRYCFPLGRLREPISRAQRADLLVDINKNHEQPIDTLIFRDKSVLTLSTFMEGPFDSNGNEVKGTLKDIGVFCGIGNPNSFFELLKKKLGVVQFVSFPDHHKYSMLDVARLNELSRVGSLQAWVTTDKDFIKVKNFVPFSLRPIFWYRLRVNLSESFMSIIRRWANEAEIDMI